MKRLQTYLQFHAFGSCQLLLVNISTSKSSAPSRFYNNRQHKVQDSQFGWGMTSQLSHRGRLPSWNRPGLCRKSGADVRKLAKDQLPSISRSAASGAGEDDEFQAKSKELAKVVQLEKNILFLKQQHHETLGQLHKEIERLRTENRGRLCDFNLQHSQS